MKKQKILWVIEHGQILFPECDILFSRSEARKRKAWLVENNPHMDKNNFKIVKFVREG